MKNFRNLYAAFGAKKFIVAGLAVFFVLSGTLARANPGMITGLNKKMSKVATVNESNISSDRCRGFEGRWDGGSYGIMTLTQDGNSVSGSYEWKGTQTIRGTVEGNVLRGKYSQPTYPEKRYRSGNVEFTLAADGNSWSGTWTDKDGNRAGTWSGRCISGN